MPVFHRGHDALLATYPRATFYILGSQIIANFRSLEKDLRALKPERIQAAVQAWDPGREVKIADSDELIRLAQGTTRIVMPDEDISHHLANQYFSNKGVEFCPIFLRWDRRQSQSQAVPTGHRVSTARDDRKLMIQAAHESQKSSDIWRRVGVIILKDGKVVFEAHNQALPHDATPWIEGDPRNNFSQGQAIEASLFIHAEAHAIALAARAGIALSGASMYVTTFPCPNCAKLIATAGISSCYYASGYSMLDASVVLESSGVALIQVDVDLPSEPEEVWAPYPQDA